MKYWLLKSEPEGYSIDKLARDKETAWTGIRNYQARNFMMKEMDTSDLVIFYHSNAEPSGCAGVARVSGAAHADETAFDRKSDYFEPRATRDKPVWECVDIEFVEKFPRFVSLEEMRDNPRLAKMELLRKGNRLSVQPVTAAEFKEVLRMAKAKTKL